MPLKISEVAYDTYRQYPWVGQWENFIVLFVSPDKGIALMSPTEYDKISISSYTERFYQPVKVTIQNV